MVFFIIEIMQANSGDPDQMLRSVVFDLGLHFLPMSHKKVARHKWVQKSNDVAYLIRVAKFVKYIVVIIFLGTSDLS